MAGLDWTHIFSPKLVNEFKLGYNRWQLRQSNQDLGNPLASNLGIMGVNQIGGVSAGVPDMTFSGYASMGGDPAVPETGRGEYLPDWRHADARRGNPHVELRSRHALWSGAAISPSTTTTAEHLGLPDS